VEFLNLSGNFTIVPYADIKMVAFVRDFEAVESEPRRGFLSRPKLDGLWVRMIFRDEDWLEGVLPNDLLQIEGTGFTVVPPDSSHSGQRVFVPRSALKAIQVLGVVGSPLRGSRRGKRPSREQIELFGEG
jgi:hypothetical protein